MKISRVSIIGGGIGGLSAALALQHFGHRVSVFEQARELREIGAGVIISPNAMHALNFLGVGKRISKEAGPTEAYLIRHFQTGEVIKIRASGTDYVERSALPIIRFTAPIFTPRSLMPYFETIRIARSSIIASRLSSRTLIMLLRSSQTGKRL